MLQDSHELYYHGILGQRWGVRRFQNPDGTLTDAGRKRYSSSTEVSDANYNRIESIYSKMPLEDKKLIDPDISSVSTPYFSDKDDYKRSVAFNSVTNDGFLIAEKIPNEFNVDGTKGIDGIGVVNKGKGAGSKLTKDLVDWFDNQSDYDVVWRPVDEKNIASIKTATKNGFIKDPLGDNYVYATDDAKIKLGISSDQLSHHGILGQRWGVRRFQNPDGTLTDEGRRHYDKLDAKWAAKNNDKVLKKAHKTVAKDMKAFNKELSQLPGYLNANGKVSKKAINAYNRRMAELMNERVSNIQSPSGKVARFVALRGEVGVQLALATPGYDMNKVSKGVWGDGRVAYRKNQLAKIDV